MREGPRFIRLTLFFSAVLAFLVAQSSDIRKWFMKPHDKNAGAAKPSGTGTGAAAAKKPVLSIPEKPAPSSVQCFIPLFLVTHSFLGIGVSLMFFFR
jgi:hypothetical protein